MSTKVSNLALRHLGSSYEISEFTTERSPEARAARAFFDIALEETLRDCALPVTRRRAKLALVSEDPTSFYRYTYRYPANCVLIRGVDLPATSAQLFGGMSAPLYEMSSDANGVTVLSNIQDLTVSYIHKVENFLFLPPDFEMALSFKLAFYMAPSITGGDPFNRGDKCIQSYEIWVDKAKANSYNEEPQKGMPPSELVAAHHVATDFGGYPISGRKDT